MNQILNTPGVHIGEASLLPPSVAEVVSAMPAFIGYTEKAQRVVADDLRYKPTVVTSLADYEQFFGGPQCNTMAAVVARDQATGAITVTVTPPAVNRFMHQAMAMYFANGGGKCCVCSVGAHADALTARRFTTGLNRVAKQDEPTLLVAPEAVRLSAAGYQTVVRAMLAQCGRLRDRFAVMDVRLGDALAAGQTVAANIEAARAAFGSSHLQYGAAYYPFVRTAITHPLATNAQGVSGSNVAVTGAVVGKLDEIADADIANAVRAELNRHHMTLPPSAAVVGVYAAVDATRGVWKAPANVSVANVIEPAVRVDEQTQEQMNVDPITGKSVNALRAFTGRGTLVWGARTLAGNDNEWRYVPVRRFFNMVEESVNKSAQWAVFEPNDANTWIKLRAMIENYLTQKWREGALTGTTPSDAFYVRCGLGQTMTAQDIVEGRLIAELGMAVVRPAEFIILKLTLKVQTP